MNQTLDGETAEEMCKIFTEVVIAPDATQEAIDLFAAKKNLRLLTTGSMADPREVAKTVRQVSGGHVMGKHVILGFNQIKILGVIRVQL